jgi:hypothetical protein
MNFNSTDESLVRAFGEAYHFANAAIELEEGLVNYYRLFSGCEGQEWYELRYAAGDWCLGLYQILVTKHPRPRRLQEYFFPPHSKKANNLACSPPIRT